MGKEIYGYINQEYVDALDSNYKALNAEALTMDEYKRCYEIAKQIYFQYKDRSELANYHNRTPERVYSDVIDDLQVFGDVRITRSATSVLNSSKKVLVNEDNPTLFTIFSKLSGNTGCYYRETEMIYIPRALADYSSPFLCHEIGHSIKNLNPEENRTIKTLEEVIPILIELITAYETCDIYTFKNVCSNRLDFMITNSCRFINSYNMIRSKDIDSEEKKLYRFDLELNACYLNSFYYVMSLFNLYLKDNILVLEYVAKVLNGEMTTKEMIKSLEDEVGSYDTGYKLGLDKFKKNV